MADGTEPKSSKSPKYLIDSILPSGAIHLVVGPSGAGKTRWLLPALEDFRQGRPVLNYSTHPVEFAYLVCDRPRKAAIETLSGMGFDPSTYHLVSLMGSKHEFSPTIFSKVFDMSKVRLIVIEGIAMLMPNGKINDYHAVHRFFNELHNQMESHDLTIIGTVHSPKSHEGEEFVHQRDNILGSVAWSACADTIIDIAPPPAKHKGATVRTLTLMPRNSAHEEFRFDFDLKGRLTIVDEDRTSEFLLDTELHKLPVGIAFDVDTVKKWAENHGVAWRTAQRWITSRIEVGQVRREKRGMYSRSNPS